MATGEERPVPSLNAVSCMRFLMSAGASSTTAGERDSRLWRQDCTGLLIVPGSSSGALGGKHLDAESTDA